MKPASQTPSVESIPVMTVNNISEETEVEEEDPGNLLIFDDSPLIEDNVSTCSKDPSLDSSRSNAPVYFRLVILFEILIIKVYV